MSPTGRRLCLSSDHTSVDDQGSTLCEHEREDMVEEQVLLDLGWDRSVERDEAGAVDLDAHHVHEVDDQAQAILPVAPPYGAIRGLSLERRTRRQGDWARGPTLRSPSATRFGA